MCTLCIYVHCAFGYILYLCTLCICAHSVSMCIVHFCTSMCISVLCFGVHCIHVYWTPFNSGPSQKGWAGVVTHWAVLSRQMVNLMKTVFASFFENVWSDLLKNILVRPDRSTLWRPSTYQFFHLSHKLNLAMCFLNAFLARKTGQLDEDRHKAVLVSSQENI